MNPVAVLIPTYEAAAFLEEALVGLRQQLTPEDQVIIQDNCSGDRTVQVVEEFAGSTGATVDYRREADLGQADALSKALTLVRRPSVIWLNADDRIDDLNTLRGLSATGVDVGCGGFLVEDLKGNILRRCPGRPLSRNLLLRTGCYQFSGAVIFRTEALRLAGGFDPQWRYCMDYDLFLRLARGGASSAGISIPVSTFRIHANSKTSSAWRGFVTETHALRMRDGRSVLPSWSLYGATTTHALAAATSRLRYSETYSRVRYRRMALGPE